MEHRNADPGAVRYGNFMNYYQFNSASERIKLLPSHDVWQTDSPSIGHNDAPYLVLDVGCNAGDFTQMLQTFLSDCLQRTVYILGVDIDQRLIERAKESNCIDEISYACVDVLDAVAFEIVLDYLKQHQRQKFDAVCCFSITMWIHLNHHDDGLQLFLRKLSELSELFVAEPQPWKCYQTANRRLKRTGEDFPLFLRLKWRSDVEKQIEAYMEQVLKMHKIFESKPTKWHRRICFYRLEGESKL